MIYSETFQIKGDKLSCLRYNEWSDKVILFFHGFTGSKNYFPNIETSKYCIVSFDRPGVGESSIVEYYSMEYFLTNIYEVLTSHNVSSVKVIGHSAGGYYAQVFAHMYPEFVSSLTLVSSMIPINCPNTKKWVSGFWKFVTFMSLYMKAISKFFFKKMAEGIVKDYDTQFTQNLKTLSTPEKEFMENHYDLIKNAVLQAVANNGFGVCYDAYALCQNRTEIKISDHIPVFIWHGTEDDTVPIEYTQYFETNYTIQSIHKIEGVGHMLYLPEYYYTNN